MKELAVFYKRGEFEIEIGEEVYNKKIFGSRVVEMVKKEGTPQAYKKFCKVL